MRDWTITSANDFEESVGVWRFLLQLDGEGGEENDLYGRSRGIPKGPERGEDAKLAK